MLFAKFENCTQELFRYHRNYKTKFSFLYIRQMFFFINNRNSNQRGGKKIQLDFKKFHFDWQVYWINLDWTDIFCRKLIPLRRRHFTSLHFTSRQTKDVIFKTISWSNSHNINTHTMKSTVKQRFVRFFIQISASIYWSIKNVWCNPSIATFWFFMPYCWFWNS